MGRNKDKNQEGAPNPASVGNRDILQRLNFLYQASVLLNGLVPSESIYRPDGNDLRPLAPSNDRDAATGQENPSLRPQTSKKKRKRRVVRVEELSRSYVETMKSVGQKTNVKLDPSVKRRICKRCSAPLIPGVSATVRIKDSTSHGHLVSYQCHCCQAERRIPAPPLLRTDPSTNLERDAMEVQSAEVSTPIVPPVPVPVSTSTGNSIRCRQQQRKKGPKPRLPPHFARDVGHIVFRGTELLDRSHSLS